MAGHDASGEFRVIDSPWLWVVSPARRGRADRAQRDAARADREPRHRRRDACALPVRISVRAVSLLGVALITGIALPRPNLSYWPWLLVGALAQIAATALMLAAMGERSFVVVVAYIKTEPIQVAIFGADLPRRPASAFR